MACVKSNCGIAFYYIPNLPSITFDTACYKALRTSFEELEAVPFITSPQLAFWHYTKLLTPLLKSCLLQIDTLTFLGTSKLKYKQAHHAAAEGIIRMFFVVINNSESAYSGRNDCWFTELNNELYFDVSLASNYTVVGNRRVRPAERISRDDDTNGYSCHWAKYLSGCCSTTIVTDEMLLQLFMSSGQVSIGEKGELTRRASHRVTHPIYLFVRGGPLSFMFVLFNYKEPDHIANMSAYVKNLMSIDESLSRDVISNLIYFSKMEVGNHTYSGLILKSTLIEPIITYSQNEITKFAVKLIVATYNKLMDEEKVYKSY
jgi:hypothetical protein